MKIQQAIDRADAMRHNMQERFLKIAWLSELDGMIWRELITKHEGQPDREEPKYDEDTDTGTELLVPFPYDNLYTYYLMQKIDEQTKEAENFNADMSKFSASYDSFSDYWTRNHMPKTRVRELRI